MKRFRRKRPTLFKSGQWHFHQDNAQVHNSILVTDYLTKMGINTVPQPPYCLDLAPCNFWLLPKPRGCRYETIEEMKEVETKVIDTLTEEDFHGALQKLLKRYNKCIAAGGDYFKGDFHVCTIIKSAQSKKSGNISYAPRIYIYIYIYIYIIMLNGIIIEPMYIHVLIAFTLSQRSFMAFISRLSDHHTLSN